MSSNYKISIIIPIFNVEKYLERALLSIINQTMAFEHFEVIMVDDCSTDNSGYIVDKYEKKYDNFIAIHHETNSGGAAMPRNTGIKRATAKYLMFLDPDDEFSKDMCEVLFNKIEDTDVDFVKCNHQLVWDKFSILDYHYDKNVSEVMLSSKDIPPDVVSVCNVIHRRELLINNDLFFLNLSAGEDIVFSISEFLCSNKMIFLNNFHGYKYYANPDISHSSIPNDKNFNSILESLFITKNLMEEKNRKDIIHPFFSKRTLPFFIRLLNLKDYNKIKHYLIEFYKFESTLDDILVFDLLWLNILNKLIMKKLFNFATIYIKLLNIVRNSKLGDLYRKTLW